MNLKFDFEFKYDRKRNRRIAGTIHVEREKGDQKKWRETERTLMCSCVISSGWMPIMLAKCLRPSSYSSVYLLILDSENPQETMMNTQNMIMQSTKYIIFSLTRWNPKITCSSVEHLDIRCTSSHSEGKLNWNNRPSICDWEYDYVINNHL